VSTAIIDITRANPGTERKLVEAVLEDLSGRVPRPGVLVVGFDGHRDTMGPVATVVEFQSVGQWALESEINQRIADVLRRKAATAGAAPFQIYSFHPTILGKQGQLTTASVPFETATLRTFLKPSNLLTEWPASLMPLDEALTALARALMRGTDVAVRVLKTNIRPLLVQEDPRFDKQNNPDAARPGLISMLLELAHKEGLVTIIGTEPRVYISVTQKGIARSGMAAASSSPRSVAVADVRQVGGDDPVSAAASGAQAVQETRSRMFQNVLRANSFGVYPEFRQKLWQQFIKLAQEAGDLPRTARELSREATARTREEADPFIKRPKNKVPLPKEQYAWKGLEEFAMRALARAGLLSDESGARVQDVPWLIPDATVVLPLPDDLGLRLDAEMIAELVRNVDDIGWEDRRELAGALLDERSDETSDRVEAMIRLLLQEHKLEWDQKRYVLRQYRQPAPDNQEHHD